MKKQLTVLLLMLCALVAQAQLMGPGYIMGNQQEKINHPKAAKIYKALYEAAERNDCTTFKKLLDTGIDPNLMVKEKEAVKIIWYIPERMESRHGIDDIFYYNIPAKIFTHEDLGVSNYYLYQPAIRAAERGNVCIIKELYEHHFRWKAPYGGGGWESLYLEAAFKNKHLELMRYLLSLPDFQKYQHWQKQLQELEAEVEDAKAKSAQAQQRAVQAEVKQSLQKKK